jgi:hypothetical protein
LVTPIKTKPAQIIDYSLCAHGFAKRQRHLYPRRVTPTHQHFLGIDPLSIRWVPGIFCSMNAVKLPIRQIVIPPGGSEKNLGK